MGSDPAQRRHSRSAVLDEGPGAQPAQHAAELGDEGRILGGLRKGGFPETYLFKCINGQGGWV
jgi:hypothetical protein